MLVIHSIYLTGEATTGATGIKTGIETSNAEGADVKKASVARRFISNLEQLQLEIYKALVNYAYKVRFPMTALFTKHIFIFSIQHRNCVH